MSFKRKVVQLIGEDMITLNRILGKQNAYASSMLANLNQLCSHQACDLLEEPIHKRLAAN